MAIPFSAVNRIYLILFYRLYYCSEGQRFHVLNILNMKGNLNFTAEMCRILNVRDAKKGVQVDRGCWVSFHCFTKPATYMKAQSITRNYKF